MTTTPHTIPVNKNGISDQWWNYWNYQGPKPDRDFIEKFWMEKLDTYAATKVRETLEQLLEEVGPIKKLGKDHATPDDDFNLGIISEHTRITQLITSKLG